MENNQGISIFMVVFFIFFGLKITDKISWSWAWVAAPLWIPISIGIIVISFVAIVGTLKILGGNYEYKNN